LDIKIFRSTSGKIYQLADLEKIKSWDAEMPLIFVGYIREKQLSNYPKSLQAEIESYLDEILENIAIPKLIKSLESPNVELRNKIGQNLLSISEANPDLLKIALPHIESKLNDSDKNFAETMNRTFKNYQKAQNKKKTAEKRKKLRKLREKMDKLDVSLTEGSISDEEYILEQKRFLKLKREIDEAEN
jgi:hypothetical protein